MMFSVRDLVWWMTLSLLGLAVLFGLITLFQLVTLSHTYEQPPIKDITPPLTKRFSEPKMEEYKLLDNSFFDLKFSPMSLKLPDLQRYLLFTGRNGRPDADPKRTALNFSFLGAKESASVLPGEPLYLYYDKDQQQVKYVFSPDNRPTSLWIQATLKGNVVQVKVFMKDEQGHQITEPKSNAEFMLQERPQIRMNGPSQWEIGKFKADSTLLSRQKARWFGEDLFINRHGGEEFEDLVGKQRVDFSDDQKSFSIYVGKNDSFIWKDDAWVKVIPSPETQEYPLLQATQIEDRLMKFDLWDVGGSNKVVLNLIRSTEGWNPMQSEKEFKFVGARTRSQFVFEVGEERVTLALHDWLLKQDKTWVKLTTPTEIDDYVSGKTMGILLVVNGIDTKEGKQVIQSTFFSPQRSQSYDFDIPILQGGVPMRYVSQPKKKNGKQNQINKNVEPEERFDEE
jgi:hypothetical protein